MATFTGTTGTDHFVGKDNKPDLFKFTPGTLSLADVVRGGNGMAIDTLRITAAGNVTAAKLAGVEGIERVELFAGDVFTATAHMFDTAGGKFINFIGSSGSDSVNCSNATSTHVYALFTAGRGSDTFIGGAGGDAVDISSAALTIKDSFDGRGGQDTLNILTTGELAQTALTHVTGFETINLDHDGNAITLLQSCFATAGGTITIRGGEGADYVVASAVTAGRVVFDGDEGGDQFFGGGGSDRIFGGSGADFFNGGGGDDVIAAQDGANNCNGDDGKDLITGGADGDTLFGGNDNDKIYGVGGADYIGGDGGSDKIFAGEGDGFIYGGAGNDRIVADSGKPWIAGGAGSDTILVLSSDFGLDDAIAYYEESDGGKNGDTILGSNGSLAVGDVQFIIQRVDGNFVVNGAYDAEVSDDGTSATGEGSSINGVDAVFYDGNSSGHVLGSVEAVDNYLYDRYYVQGAGVFVIEKNADSSVTIYFDPNAYSHGASAVVVLANVGNYAGTAAGLEAYFSVI